MAIKLIGSYSKRLGLPAYSSHQFSVTIETELTGLDDIAQESARLYETLQRSVDEQIQQTGFIPQEGYGQSLSKGWKCSEKQKQLILALIEEHQLSKEEVEALASERFAGKAVRHLTKGETSLLIDLLLTHVNSGEQVAA